VAGVPYIDRMLGNWFRSDVETRARLVMNSMEAPLTELLAAGDLPRLRVYLDRIAGSERLVGALICNSKGAEVVRSVGVPPGVRCQHEGAGDESGEAVAGSARLGVFRFPLQGDDGRLFQTILVHDLSYIDRRQTRARAFVLSSFVIAIVALAALAGIGFRLLLHTWTRRLLGDLRNHRFMDNVTTSGPSAPLFLRVREVLKELEEQQRQEIEYQENWTPLALQRVVQDHLPDCQMLVVSNREPYAHHLDASGTISVHLPASGMVTAVEPIMRACSGTWIAHGSGSGDRLVVDARDCVRVPPEDPAYTLRRVWLSEEQEQGYYYGFSTEGLWSLCHMAYVRPAFRERDWQCYQEVNAKFADAVAREAGSGEAVVLIQDFHFALLPKLIRERRVRATIAVFWHIPWPTAESFGVCPWRRQLLEHMLQADILGFHTLQHCRSFLETVDRYMECRIDHERMIVTIQGHECRVAAYPISIEWPPRWLANTVTPTQAQQSLRERFAIPPDARIILGVERWDFTKGILERLHAVEALLEKASYLVGKFVLLQVAAPSRSKLQAYQTLQEQTLAEVARINARFATAQWQPIVLLAEHQEPPQVFELYRACDVMIVNSLHDGMNLVSKEFVASRDDEDGVLILSTLAGASREMHEALLVNPYDIGETARAMAAALEMPREERRKRMRLMRRTVAQNNVYRWAGRMLIDIARIRQRRTLANWRERSQL
jgi:trehalose 6-phosphate synthase